MKIILLSAILALLFVLIEYPARDMANYFSSTRMSFHPFDCSTCLGFWLRIAAATVVLWTMGCLRLWGLALAIALLFYAKDKLNNKTKLD